MRKLLLIVFVLLLAVAGFVGWFVQDANRFKPALIAYVEREAGIPIEVRGHLAWRFTPRLWLAAEGLHADHDGRAWSLERLDMRPDVLSLLGNPGALKQWRIEEASLRNLAVEDHRGLLRASRLNLRNIGPGNPMPVEARLVYVRENLAPVEVGLAGTLEADARHIRVRDLSFQMPNAGGVCNLEAMPNGKLLAPLAPQEAGILPLEVMRAYDWDGRCGIERIVHGGETIENVRVLLDNKEGGSIVAIGVPEFLGGKAQLEIVVRADRSPVAWDVKPVLAGVDSRRLAAWLGGSSPVAAPLDYGGTISMSGNTVAALAASVAAQTRISTGAGEFDSGVFAPLSEAAALWNSSGAKTPLPATLDYGSLNGHWIVEKERHRLNMDLDSLNLEAEGDYLPREDRLDMRGVITLGNGVGQWGLPLDPALADVPFHFRCVGTAAEPGCGLDVERTVLGAIAAEGSTLAGDLVQEYVPEEYQGTARSVLGSLEEAVDTALRKDPNELVEDHVPEEYRGITQWLIDQMGKATEEGN